MYFPNASGKGGETFPEEAMYLRSLDVRNRLEVLRLILVRLISRVDFHRIPERFFDVVRNDHLRNLWGLRTPLCVSTSENRSLATILDDSRIAEKKSFKERRPW